MRESAFALLCAFCEGNKRNQALYPRYISLISPLYLPYISPISRLYLAFCEGNKRNQAVLLP